MRALVWALRALVFLLLFAFAARNTEPVNLRLFFDLNWQVPLVVLLLGFFVAGGILGMLAVSGVIYRLRREIARLKALPTDSLDSRAGL